MKIKIPKLRLWRGEITLDGQLIGKYEKDGSRYFKTTIDGIMRDEFTGDLHDTRMIVEYKLKLVPKEVHQQNSELAMAIRRLVPCTIATYERYRRRIYIKSTRANKNFHAEDIKALLQVIPDKDFRVCVCGNFPNEYPFIAITL